MIDDRFAVYIMANKRPTVYVGVTNNLVRRVFKHKNNFNPKSFTARYKLYDLVYYELMGSNFNAIVREKQIKNMSRQGKIDLITNANPDFKDLYQKIVEGYAG